MLLRFFVWVFVVVVCLGVWFLSLVFFFGGVFCFGLFFLIF